MLFTRCAASYCEDLLAKRRNTELVGPYFDIRELSRPQRQRRWERRQTKGLMSKTKQSLHLRFKSLYITYFGEPRPQRQILCISLWN